MPQRTTGQSAELDSDLLPPVVDRMRLGLTLLASGFAVYFVVSQLGAVEEPPGVMLVQSGRMALLLACLFVVRRWPNDAVAKAAGAVAIAGVSVSLALNGLLRHELASNAIVSTAVTLGSAALLPWGPVAQLCVAVVAAGSILVNAMVLPEDPVKSLSAAASVTLLICMGSSVYLASTLARSRRALERRLRLDREADEAMRADHDLITALHRAELSFITERAPDEIFSIVLDELLSLTGSKYGFIGEVLQAEDGHQFLKCHVISNLAWNDETRALYEAQAPNLEFHKLDNLFGLAITSGATVISNDPKTDPRRTGFPKGHPSINTFVGMPLLVGGELVGMVGLANRPAGYDEALVEYLQPFLTSCAQMISSYRTDRRRRVAEEQVRVLNATLERRVTERTLELELANRDLTRFSASVSHDLRAPLRSIASFSQLLVDDYGKTLEPTAVDYLTRVQAAANRMDVLIDDLLGLARLGRIARSDDVVDLAPVARSILDELAQQSPERSVEVVIGDDLTARGDPRLLRIMLENLLGNAWKFTSRRQDARIEFASRSEEGERIYFVRDNGVGFDIRFVDKLFQPFERLHHDEGFVGTGIGLATVQTIVQRHGGRVWAESALGEGATFYFVLPA
ncbi:MAG TPA: GAF domain-containing protein [Candidatus Limnocylindrales bacterium]|nr:GAF domain-containing protein [Candidatus Limnocylindrales bacterium]